MTIKLSEIKKLCDEATPEAWIVKENEHDHWGQHRVRGPSILCQGFTSATDITDERRNYVEADCKFIAASRSLVPELVSWIERARPYLQAQLEEFKECDKYSSIKGSATKAFIDDIEQLLAEVEE